MSRFELYGTVKCGNCGYHRKSSKCPHYRCDYPENIGRTDWLGPVYMRRPDDINYTQKCEWFKANKNQKEK